MNTRLADPDSLQQPRAGAFVLAWGTMLVMLGITVATTLLVERSVHSAANARFEAIEQNTSEKIQQRMQAYEQILRGGVALFATQPVLTRRQWHDYIMGQGIAVNFPGIQGVGYAERVSAAERETHEERIRAEGFPAYRVRTSGTPAELTPIIFIEPFTERNQRAFGYDMFSESVRRAAMIAARDTGRATLSGRVRLLQETTSDVQAGVLLYLPLYGGVHDPGTMAARRAMLRGYVYAPFRLHNLMHGILGSFNDSVDMALYDGPQADPRRQLFAHSPDGVPGAVSARPQFERSRVLTLYGRQWTVVLRSTRLFESRTLVFVPHLVMVAGLIISALISSLVWSLSTRRQKALLMARDMTEALREREAFISAVVDHAADGIVTFAPDGRVLSLNQAAERIFGWTSAQAPELTLSMLLPALAEPACLGEAPTPFSLLGLVSVQEGERRNGERFALEISVSEIEVGDNRAYTAIVRDISGRLQAVEALRRSEERFVLAFQASNDGLWDWSLEDSRVYFSPSWCTMLGYEPDEVPQTVESWQDIVHPDDYPQFRTTIDAYARGELPAFHHEHRMRHKDGHYMWILSRAFAQRDQQGRAFRLVGLNTDIDQRKQVEQMKSHFISVVSHELRTPVTSIYGSIMLLRQKAVPQSDVERTLIDMALRNSESLLTLISDLLDMDKIQSGKLDIQKQPLALWPLIEESCARNHSYADQYGIRFELVPPADDLWVAGDSTRLLQVMSNLLSNAAKFSPSGSPVEIGLQRDGSQACISVTDHGEGIPHAFRDRIFSKFSQADSSSSRPRNGSGLGLNISRSIIEALGGTISFDSTEGAGTAFYVRLPLIPAPAQPPAPAHPSV